MITSADGTQGSAGDAVIEVLIVDDQELLRRGLRLVLETVPDIEVCAEAGDGAEALAQIAHRRPDVVLTDARMPGMDGLSLVAALAESAPALPVLVLTTFDDEQVVLGALGTGASGFLLKDVSPDRLAEAIRAVHAGDAMIDPRVTRTVLRGQRNGSEALTALTPAERKVAELVALGRSNTEIAEMLVLAEGTVKNHVSALLRKLGQRDRTALALCLHRLING